MIFTSYHFSQGRQPCFPALYTFTTPYMPVLGGDYGVLILIQFGGRGHGYLCNGEQ